MCRLQCHVNWEVLTVVPEWTKPTRWHSGATSCASQASAGARCGCSMQDTVAPGTPGWRPNNISILPDVDSHLLSDEDLLAFLDKDGLHPMELHSLLSPGVNQVNCLEPQYPHIQQACGKEAAAVTGTNCSLSPSSRSSQDTFAAAAAVIDSHRLPGTASGNAAGALGSQGHDTVLQELQSQLMLHTAGTGNCIMAPASSWQTQVTMPESLFRSSISQGLHLSAAMPSVGCSTLCAMHPLQVQPGLSNPLPAGCTLSFGGMQPQQQRLLPASSNLGQQQQHQHPAAQPQVPLLQVPPVSFMQLLADSPVATATDTAEASNLQAAAADATQHLHLSTHGRGLEQLEHQAIPQQQQQDTSLHGQAQDQQQQQQVGNSSTNCLPRCRAPFIPRVLSQVQLNKRVAEHNDALVLRPATCLTLPASMITAARQSRKGTKQAAVAVSDASVGDSSHGTAAADHQAPLPTVGTAKKKTYSRDKKIATAMLRDSMQHHTQRGRHRVNLEHQFKLWKQLTQTEEAADAAVAADQSTVAMHTADLTANTPQDPAETPSSEVAVASTQQPLGTEAPAKVVSAAPPAADKGQKLSYKTPHDLAKVVEELFLSDSASHLLHLPLCRPGQPQLQLINTPASHSKTVPPQQFQQQQEVEQQHSAAVADRAKLEKQHAKAWAQVVRYSQSLDEATRVAEMAMQVAELQQMQLHPRTLEAGRHRKDVAAAMRRFLAVKRQRAGAYAAACRTLLDELSPDPQLQPTCLQAGESAAGQQQQSDMSALRTAGDSGVCTNTAESNLSTGALAQPADNPDTSASAVRSTSSNIARARNQGQRLLQNQHVCQQQQWQDARCTVSRIARAKSSQKQNLQHQQQQVHTVTADVTGSTQQQRGPKDKPPFGAVDSSVMSASTGSAAATAAAHVKAPSELQLKRATSTKDTTSRHLYCLQAAAAAASEYFAAMLSGSNQDVTAAFPVSALNILQRAAAAAPEQLTKERQVAEASHRGLQGTTQPSSGPAPAAARTKGAAETPLQQQMQCSHLVEQAAEKPAEYAAATDSDKAAGRKTSLVPGSSISRPQRKRKRSAALNDYQAVEDVLQQQDGVTPEETPIGSDLPSEAELLADQAFSEQADADDGDKDLLFNLSSRSFSFKRRTGPDKGKSITITTEALKQLYDLPMKEAAKALGASEGATVLKKICRQLGIKRWPQRKRRCVRNLIDEVESYRASVGWSSEAEDILRQLTHTLEELDEDPNLDLDPRIKQLRQAISKQLYKARMKAST